MKDIGNPTSHWTVGVVIPARDEERTITGCLEATFRALEVCQSCLGASWIVVVADSCNDGTAAIARRVLNDRGCVIECSSASPGMARKLGAAEILAHFNRRPTRQIWMANTDADSCVAPNWLKRQLDLASLGYCAVAGIVRVETAEGLDPETLRALMADYTIYHDGSHPHVHGANLGIRADAYIDAGCWSNLALAEDHCLWSRVRARGWPTASCSKTIVHTSGRLHGRAGGGFADSLRAKLQRLQSGVATCTP